MRSKRYVCLIFCIALFALIAIRAGASAMIYDYASKENFEKALFDNLTTTSNIGVRKSNDGDYWFFEPNTSSANGPSCCEGDLLKRVYARLDQYGSVIISKETDGDKTSYRIFPEYLSIVGGLLPYTYGWGTPYTPGYPYQWEVSPGGWGTPPAFDVGYSYPWGGFPGAWGTSPAFGVGYPYPWGGFSGGWGTSPAFSAGYPYWGNTYYPSQYGLEIPYFGELGYGSALIGYDNQYGQSMADAYAMTLQNYFYPSLYSMLPMTTQTLSGNADLPTRIDEPNPPSRHAAAFNNPFLF